METERCSDLFRAAHEIFLPSRRSINHARFITATLPDRVVPADQNRLERLY
jgi:hypothetical protein